ncbi:MAG TPA: hypothetical protein VM261_01385 [Kofleriaceae bacterium]|nr:hypothetical protein [Kofleriaceae bacterium]
MDVAREIEQTMGGCDVTTMRAELSYFAAMSRKKQRCRSSICFISTSSPHSCHSNGRQTKKYEACCSR